jgi:hypothetical protein
VLESRSRQPTLPREPQQANTRDLESPRIDRSAKGSRSAICSKGGRGRCAPRLDSPWLSPGCGTLRGAPRTSATAAVWMSDRRLDAFALPPDVLAQKHSPQLGKDCRRCTVEHGEDRDPVGNREPDLGLLRDQRSLKRVSLVGEIRTSQPGCEVKHTSSVMSSPARRISQRAAKQRAMAARGSSRLAP